MKFDYCIEQRLVSTYSMLDVDSAQCAQSWGHYIARYVG